MLPPYESRLECIPFSGDLDIFLPMSKNPNQAEALIPENGSIEFSRWETPFENMECEIIEVAFAPKLQWSKDSEPLYRDNSIIKSGFNADLIILIEDQRGRFYRIIFEKIVAMRLLDEAGLTEIWQASAQSGGRPGQTTFKVRNHSWTKESSLEFIQTAGWSFMIATENHCLEIVSFSVPEISENHSPSA